MPPFWRRRDPAEITKAVEEGVARGVMSAVAASSGAKVTDARQDMAALTTNDKPNTLLSAYFNEMPWVDPDVAFGPQRPIRPAAIDPVNARGRTEPRTYQYPVAWNLNLGELRHCPFAILRKAAEVDLVRRCIEIRKADIVGLEWDITLSDNAVRKAMDETGERNRAKASIAVRAQFEDQIQALKTFWAKPDRLNNRTFSQWLNSVLEEVLVTDALSIYPHPTMGGPVVPGLDSTTHSLRVLDGSTIKPLFDHLGNLPQPPNPAYQQILYGFPRGEYSYDPNARGEMTHDTLMYRPRNSRVTSPYGLPPVEQALPFIDLWLKRQEWLRAEYGVGANPNTWLKPEGEAASWTPQQRKQMESALNDDLSGQTQERVMLHLLPPGLVPVEMTEFSEKYKSDWDDMLALRLAAFFDVMSTQLNITPKGGLGGKGHQEGETAKSEAQARMPTINFLVDLLNDLNVQYMGAPEELTFIFRSEDEDDVAEVTQSRQVELFSGQLTLNDLMAEAGRPLYDFAEADMPFVLAPGAPMVFLEGASETPDAPAGTPFPPKGGAPDPTDPTQQPPPPQPVPPELNKAAVALKSKADVHYQPASKPGQNCHTCTHRIDNGDALSTCALVEGTVDPEHVCDLWAAEAAPTGTPAEKAAEVAAFKRFSSKPHSRKFAWNFHDPDEAKAIEADLKKAPARLPGEEFRSALEGHYAKALATALRDSADGIADTVARVDIHRTKAVDPADLQAAEMALSAGVTFDRARLLEIVRNLYADAYLAGSNVALDQLGSGATLSGSIADHVAAVDWDNWRPGYAEAAAKDAQGGLADLLRSADITVRGVTDSALSAMANVLAQGMERGDSVDTVSRALDDLLGDPARSDRFAVTETARAMTQASLDAYSANDVAQWNWLLTAGACEACEDQQTENPHDLTDDAPPEHPNCRCAIAPIVVVGGQETEGEEQ